MAIAYHGTAALYAGKTGSKVRYVYTVEIPDLMDYSAFRIHPFRNWSAVDFCFFGRNEKEMESRPVYRNDTKRKLHEETEYPNSRFLGNRL